MIVDPRDPDIAANLALARVQTVDQLEAVNGDGLLVQAGAAVQNWLTLNEMAMLALGAWILFVFTVILFGSARSGTAWRKGLQYALVVTTILLAAGVVALGSYLYLQSNDNAGVIVAAEVDVTSGPGTQYASVETLHSGAEVNLSETRGNWVRLTLPDEDLEGWVPASTVEAVTP